MDIKWMVENGLSQRQIGIKIGKSQGSVRHTLKKMGLNTKKSKNMKFQMD